MSDADKESRRMASINRAFTPYIRTEDWLQVDPIGSTLFSQSLWQLLDTVQYRLDISSIISEIEGTISSFRVVGAGRESSVGVLVEKETEDFTCWESGSLGMQESSLAVVTAGKLNTT